MKRCGALVWSFLGLSALLVMTLVLLGNWQLRRLDWKLELIDAIEQRSHAEPVPAPTGVVSRAEDAYRRVVLSGNFRHEHTRVVKAVTDLGPGYWVMTPLDDGQQALWINRGFIPAEHRERGRYNEPAGTITISGLLRISEPKGTLLQKNEPTEGRWYSRDAEALSADAGIDARTDYFIDADKQGKGATGDWPRGGLTRLDHRNPHLTYALTWYAMALGLSLALVYVIRLEHGEQ